MAYQQMLVDGLKGARVRNQNEILATLMQLRPEQLAQLIQSNDLDSFEELTHFGTERSRKILDSFRESVDPLALEITAIEDRIAIELNVATDRTAALQRRVRSFARTEVHGATADPSGEKGQPAHYRSAGGQPRQSFYF